VYSDNDLIAGGNREVPREKYHRLECKREMGILNIGPGIKVC
jgi:hypothetical protein